MLYSTIPKVYYIINTWRILAWALVIRNPMHPTIPHGTLPKSQAQPKMGDYCHFYDDFELCSWSRRGS